MTPTEIQEVQKAIMDGLKSIPVVTDPTPVPVPAVKPAWQTTEFWGHAVVVLLGLLMVSGAVQTGSGLDRIVGLITMALSQFGYSVSRGLTKMNVPTK